MAEKATRTLYVSNLGPTTSKEDLEVLIRKFANVRQVTVVKDDVTGENRGYGFVELDTAEEVQIVLAKKHELAIDGQQLNVQVSRPPKEVQDALILQQSNQLMSQPQYYQDPSTGQYYMIPSTQQAQIMYASPTGSTTAYLPPQPPPPGILVPPGYVQPQLAQTSVSPPVPPPPGPPPPASVPSSVPIQGQRFSPY